MTLPPDKTFRDKLLDYQKAAPHAAWDRIEKGLDGSSNKHMWFKVAAAIIVLAIPLFMLWPKGQAESVAVTNSKEINSQPVVVEEKSEQYVPPVEEEVIQPSEKKNFKASSHQTPFTGKSEIKQATVAELDNDIKDDFTDKQIIASPKPDNEELDKDVKTTASAKNKSSVIVYSAEEVNARFLRGNKSKSRVTSDNEKVAKADVDVKSDHFKISDVAAAIKNNETSFGDLRQIKDDLLSFDFLANNDKSNKNKAQ